MSGSLTHAGTLAALKAQRRELVEPRLAAYSGRIVKLMDDVAEVWLSRMSRWRTWDGAIGVAAKMKTGVREWMIAGFCGWVALLTSCAPAPEPPVTALVTPEPALPARAHASPRMVQVTLAANYIETPYSPEELALPAIKSIIAQCVQQAGENCQSRRKPGPSRTRFVRTQDDMVVITVELGGLEVDREYEVAWRLFDPNDQMHIRYSLVFRSPRGLTPQQTLTYVFSWGPPDPPSWQLGQWRAEIIVNGQKEAERSFVVVEQIQ